MAKIRGYLGIFDGGKTFLGSSLLSLRGGGSGNSTAIKITPSQRLSGSFSQNSKSEIHVPQRGTLTKKSETE